MKLKNVSRSQLSQKVISHHAVLSSITRTSSHFSDLLFTTHYFDLYSHILSSWFILVCYCRVLILIWHQKANKGTVFVRDKFVNRTQLNYSYFSERFSLFLESVICAVNFFKFWVPFDHIKLGVQAIVSSSHPCLSLIKILTSTRATPLVLASHFSIYNQYAVLSVLFSSHYICLCFSAQILIFPRWEFDLLQII